MGDWTFFSNYGLVLVCLARDRRARLRDVAQEVGITERAVQKIVRDLQDGGYLTVTKQGRCNRYRINRRKSLRHALVAQCTAGKLLTAVVRPEPAGAAAEQPAAHSGPVAQPPPAAEPRAAKPRQSAPPQARQPTASPDEAMPTAVADKPREEKKQKKKRGAPVDTRQQGSLF